MRILLMALSLFIAIAFGKNIIEVGTGNSYRPFAFTDENNELTGYDIDVLRLLEKYDSSLKFHFNGLPWNAIFVGLDSGKYDLLAFGLTKTKEREKKYIFSDHHYFNDISTVIVRSDNNISDYKQLNGYKIGVSVGSNYALDIENFLKKHPDIKAEIKYYKSPPALIADLGTGRIQAVVGEPISASLTAEAQGLSVKDSGILINKTPVFFIFKKSDKALKNKMSQALKKAIDNGDISKLSIKYFGKDLSQVELRHV